ncbi:MAG: hypothetical protein ACREEM_24185 [Blastocatellia bacterium]
MKPVYGRVEESGYKFFRVNRKSRYRANFLWHFHHVFELNLMIHGRGTRFVGDHIGHYEDGDLVLMAPNLPHTWYADPLQPGGNRPHDSVGIQFAASFLGTELYDEAGWRHIGRLLERAARGVEFTGETRRAALKKIVRLDALEGPARLIDFLQVLDALAHSPEYRLRSSQNFNPSLDAHTGKRIDKVCGYLSRHYTHPLKLEEIAGIASLSVSAFSHFFRTATGKTFTTYSSFQLSASCGNYST